MSEASDRTAEEIPLPGGNLQLFLTRLAFQGMLSLGLMENPVTGIKQVNMDQARMILDDLLMLQEKTLGNLSADEAQHMAKVVDDFGRLFEAIEAKGTV